MKLRLSLLLTILLLSSGKLMAIVPVKMTSEAIYPFCGSYGLFSFQTLGFTGTILSVDVDFGDGTTGTYPGIGTNLLQITRSYMAPGTYIVSAEVHYTSSGSSSSSSYPVTGSITLVAAPTQAEFAGFTVSNSGSIYSFNYSGNAFSGHSYTLDFGDGSTSTGTALSTGQLIASHTYADGTYLVKLTHVYVAAGTDISCSWVQQTTLKIGAPPSDPCCSNFSPEPRKEYWLSAWVQEAVPSQVISYSNKVYVELEFTGTFAGSQFVRIYPSEDIVEKWQRIVGRFAVPVGTDEIKIHTVNDNDYLEAYFDDIRIHPFNGSMKSYVYDPFTLLLTAELDDNNYATFYEYDKEGQLIRIKKETARGIMTIQESRSSNPKKSN